MALHNYLLSSLILLVFVLPINAQNCTNSISLAAEDCDGFYFSINVSVTSEETESDSFLLMGNGTYFGKFGYGSTQQFGPYLANGFDKLNFIAVDVEDPACQSHSTFTVPDCGPICSYQNASLEGLSCLSQISALVEFNMTYQNNPSPAFQLFYENGDLISTFFYENLPIAIPFFLVNGAAPIVLTVCDNENKECCQTFTFDAIDCNPSNCEMFGLTLDPECLTNNFLVHLDFGYDNTPSDSFNVAGNGLNYGTFAYSDLPISIGPLNGHSAINWEFAVTDKQNPSCGISKLLGTYNCPPPCNVLSANASPQVCNGDDAYSLQLELNIEGEGDSTFFVFSPSKYYGEYSYDGLPSLIPSFLTSGNFYDTITICDIETPGCCATVEYEALQCAGCLIYNLDIVPQPCNEEDEIFVVIDFDYTNTSTNFRVTGNGTSYGVFSYEQLPVSIGPFDGDGSQVFEFVISDEDDIFCFAAEEIGLIGCDDICELTNLTIDPGGCTGNGLYEVVINFDYQGVSGLGFDLYINDDHFGFYSYNELPLTIEEFPNGGTDIDVVRVCENDNVNCCATATVTAPSCECAVFDASVQVGGCTSDSTFAISLEFYTINTPSNFVDIYLDGAFIGFYNANAIPIVIDDIPEGDGTSVVTICANDAPDCCVQLPLELMQCDGPTCQLFELFAEAGECNSDSTYLVDFTFEHQFLPTDSVLVWANDSLVGKFEVTEPFNRIENFPTLETQTITLTVCGDGAPDCCDTFTFEAPDCSTFDDCILSNLTIDPGNCNGNGETFQLTIEFDYVNTPGDFVTIFANGEEIGTRIINGGHIEFTEFPLFAEDVVEMTVCALGDTLCCITGLYVQPDCQAPPGCAIEDLNAIIGPCTSLETYDLTLTLQANNLPAGEWLKFTANGVPFDTLQNGSGVHVFPNFPVTLSNHTVITVCALSNPSCCATIEFETPDCDGENCVIFELVATPGDCITDSTYIMTLNYQTHDFIGDSIDVRVNGEYFGTFEHNSDGVIIPEFPAVSELTTYILVCATDAPDCCEDVSFSTPDCGGNLNCEVEIVEVNVRECTSDSTYEIRIDFATHLLPSEHIIVWANDSLIGEFPHEPSVLELNDFPILEDEEITLIICASASSECCDTVVFIQQDCGTPLPCDIFDLSVNVFDCNSDSTFVIVADFDWVNITHSGFDLYAGDQYLGFFSAENVPLEINNFPSNESGEYQLRVCESDNPECCEEIVFDGPQCHDPTACDLWAPTFLLTLCNDEGEFSFILDFEHINTGSQGFSVFGNGNEYGTFQYENLPIEIGPFSNDNTVFEFVFRDNEFQDCQLVIVPGDVECITGVSDIEASDVFQILNNGTLPVLYAKQNLSMSIYTIDGQDVLLRQPVVELQSFELDFISTGIYIGRIEAEGQTWIVKFVRIE